MSTYDATARLIVAVGAGEPLTDAAESPRTVWDETTRLYTSGTTGMPKGVPLNGVIEIFSAHDVIMHFPLPPGDKTMTMTPWFHRGGLHSGAMP